MISEELHNEINKRLNVLVMNRVAKSLEEDLSGWLSANDIDPNLSRMVNEFVSKLREYIIAKRQYHKVKKNDLNDLDVIDSFEYKWRIKRAEKNKIKEKLIEAGVDYKKYQKQ